MLVLYAPQRGRPHDESQARCQTRSHCQHDLHGRFELLGSVTCDGIGDHAADMEDGGGERFREFCIKQNLTVPSTFAHWHGATNTFVSAHNTTSRLDCIAVSSACSTKIAESSVDPESTN